MKALEREVGEEALTDVLLHFLTAGAMPGNDAPSPPPRKPPRTGATRGKRGKPKGIGTDDPDDLDDDNNDQLSLF